MTDFQDRGDAARRAAGIDGTAGDAQDIPHAFVLNKPRGGCLLCGLTEAYRKHTTPADELRAAADKMRTFPGPAADPTAEWLAHEAEAAKDTHLYAEREPCPWCGEPGNAHALAVARAINGGQPS